MDVTLYTNNFLLEWEIPDAWNTHVNKLKVSDWRKASKTISITTILFFSTVVLFDEKNINWINILLFSLLLSIFIYFGVKFLKWASNPTAKIYKSVIRIRYWHGMDEIDISKIENYYFNRLKLGESEISVLVLRLKNDTIFEIGIPNQRFEENVKHVLSVKLQISFDNSFQL